MLTDFGGLKVWNEIWQSITRSFGKLLVQEWFFKEENSRSRNHEGIIFSTKHILPQIRSLVSTWRLKQWRLHSSAAETRESTVIKCNPGSTTQTQWPQGGAVGTSCIYLVKTKNRNKKIMKAFNKNPSWTDPARGRRDVRVLHPSQSDRDSHQFTDFINWKGGCVGGAAGADCLIRWFLTDLPTSFLSLFSSLGAGRWELAVIFMHSDDAFKWLSYYTAVVKKQNLAAVLASCRQKEAIKAKTPSRLDGWGAPFSLLSQLLLPKITEVDFCRSSEAPSVSFQLHSAQVSSLVLKVTDVRWPALRFSLQAHNISLQRAEHPGWAETSRQSQPRDGVWT